MDNRENIKYQRKIIGVESKLGFMYIPAKAQELMPGKTGKFRVLLQGNKDAVLLSYNAEHKRIFGLTPWYKKFNIKETSVLDVELSSDLLKISIPKQKEKPKYIESEEEAEGTIDISGLSSTEKGNIMEERIKELILIYGQGLLNVYKPVIDSRGIDLIVMRDGVFMPIFIQVKSRFNTSKTGSLLIDVNENTFRVHHSFYIVGAAYNPHSLEIEDNILFVPSEDYNKNASVVVTKKGRRIKRMSVSVKENTRAKGAKFFIKKTELVEKLMEKFAEMERYLK